MGICLIEACVFQRLSERKEITRYPVQPFGPHGLHGELLGFFDHLAKDGVLFSEDFSFCERWRMLCEGEVWCYLAGDVSHVGDMAYNAKLIHQIA